MYSGPVGPGTFHHPASSAICESNICLPVSSSQSSLLQRSVDAFFAFHPHAGRLFHAPTFMATLSLPPNHPDFPSPCILHAICAVGSLYSMAVLPTPPPEKSMAAGMSEGDNLYGSSTNHRRPSDEIFGNRYRRKDHIESFAEVHVQLAKQTAKSNCGPAESLLRACKPC